jgi:hypothetical protein
MNKIITTALAAMLLAAPATIALAQAPVEAGASNALHAPAVGGAAGANVDANSEASPAVISGAPVDLSGVTENTTVGIVRMSSLQAGATINGQAVGDTAGATINGQTVGDTPGADADAMATLHATVEDNAAIKAKLDAAGYGVEDVVAVANNVDGSIVVYVEDRG